MMMLFSDAPRYDRRNLQTRFRAAAAATAAAVMCMIPDCGCPACIAGQETRETSPASRPPEVCRKDLKSIVDEQSIYVETAKPGVRLSGYLEASYTNQFAGKNENGSASTEHAQRADLDHNDFNINAFKLVLEKELSEDTSEWSAGFRTDIWFGEDALMFGASDSNNDLFFHQAFVSLRVPVGNGLIVKMGKIAGLLGYEAEERPENMNYSYGLMSVNFYNAASTGILLTYPITNQLEATLGMVSSWDGSDGGAFGMSTGGFGLCVTGQMTYTVPGKNAWLAGTFFVAPDGAPALASPAFLDNQALATGEITGEWRPKFVPNERLTLAFDLMAGFAGSGTDSAFGEPSNDNTAWWGLSLYSKYRFNSLFTLAGRAEYIHNDDSGKILGTAIPGNDLALPLGSRTDVWSGTITAGFDLWENVQTRVEYRYDRGPDDTINGLDQHQISVDMTYSF